MRRKIIDMFVEPRPEAGTLYNIFCLCDDGTIWIHFIGSEGDSWKQLENIPQPETVEETLETIKAHKTAQLNEIRDAAENM
jgi:hypothetical protein